jgi:hypothetical protein
VRTVDQFDDTVNRWFACGYRKPSLENEQNRGMPIIAPAAVLVHAPRSVVWQVLMAPDTIVRIMPLLRFAHLAREPLKPLEALNDFAAHEDVLL